MIDKIEQDIKKNLEPLTDKILSIINEKDGWKRIKITPTISGENNVVEAGFANGCDNNSLELRLTSYPDGTVDMTLFKSTGYVSSVSVYSEELALALYKLDNTTTSARIKNIYDFLVDNEK